MIAYQVGSAPCRRDFDLTSGFPSTMTSERWQQINALLDAALERSPDQRHAYLDAHCRNDPDLHREVLSLLEAHDQAQSFLEEPANVYAAPLIPMPDAATDPLLGKTIDGYRILSVLGRGGMGVVYKAEDEALSRTVAIKMIDPTLARDESFVRRFRAEARALARIDSRHIVRVHAMRQTEGGLFIVMECVDGGTVTDMLRGGAVAWGRAMPVIKQMLLALEHAHSVGVVHRDIKPSNIMLTSQGMVKVTDFGLAKMRQAGGATTVTQGIAGTLLYMSPEQVEGSADLDHRSDIYSMGMTIYQMLAGRLPLDRDEVGGDYAIMRAIVEDDLPPPSTFKQDLPRGLVDAVMKALEKDPNRRYQSAAEMRAAFEALQSSAEAQTIVDTIEPYKREKPKRPVALWVSSGLLGVALLVLLGYILWPKASPPLLTLTTLPAQATVFIGGDSVGTTPLESYPLAAGTERIALRVQKAGYTPIETTRQIVDGVPLNVVLTLEEVEAPPDDPTHAMLQIVSSTGNARVQINGESQGTTDASGRFGDVEVEPGAIEVVITKAGYDTWRGTFEVAAGETVPVPATLIASGGGQNGANEATGTLTVQVEPRGTIAVQGVNCQPGAPCRVPAGTQRVTCREGGYEATQTVRVRPNQQHTLTCYTEHRVILQVRKEDGGQCYLGHDPGRWYCF